MAKFTPVTSKDSTIKETGVSEIRNSQSDHDLSLEDVQVDLEGGNIRQKTKEENHSDQPKNHEDVTAKRIETHSSRAARDRSQQYEDRMPWVTRRRVGIVKESDEVLMVRRKARVLRKRFGEELIHETPSIFNKKL